ncbi:MAG: molybdopterin-dependent oxidoreductase [Anaerolineae bacterium]|nr:molybdopterin-dependent oxidoreductase [Anaerolineae bacterium]
MNKLTRRQFVRLAAGAALLPALGACGEEEAMPTGAPTATPQPAARSAGATGTPGQPFFPGPTATLPPVPDVLRNENVPGFYVRYYRPLQPVSRDTWVLEVDGLVRSPQELSLTDVLALPRIAQVSRMACVEGWSAAAAWEGFHLSGLMEVAQPAAEAQWVHMHCADGYYESMSIESLLRERAIWAHQMNGNILPEIYGAPLRLMIPWLYGYKSAKAITRIEFAAEEMVGYWPDVGPYTTEGTIRRGRDYPLDLPGGSRAIEGGGEIFYPDGIESRE